MLSPNILTVSTCKHNFLYTHKQKSNINSAVSPKAQNLISYSLRKDILYFLSKTSNVYSISHYFVLFLRSRYNLNTFFHNILYDACIGTYPPMIQSVKFGRIFNSIFNLFQTSFFLFYSHFNRFFFELDSTKICFI